MVAVVNEVVDEFSFEMFKRIEVLYVKRFGFEYPEEVFYYSIVQTDDCMQFLLSVPVPISDSSVPFSRSSPPS